MAFVSSRSAACFSVIIIMSNNKNMNADNNAHLNNSINKIAAFMIGGRHGCWGSGKVVSVW